jgi:type VI secretion system VasD/TssJ family lipoprotein
VKIARAWATSAALVVLAGCGGPLIMQFKGGEKLNQNDKTPPENIPVDVRIFLLKDKASFEAASVEQLWKKEQYTAVLGQDLVGEPREINVTAQGPGDAPKKLDLGSIPADVRYVGIMAMISKKTDPPSVRHKAVPKQEADDYLFQLVEYRLEAKK